MTHYKPFLALAAFAALAATPANAEDVDQAAQVIADQPEPSAEAAVLNDDELGELRGGEGMIITNQTLVAITSGNVINGDYIAGNISLSDFALSNFNGLGNMLINSGAQVSLQTGMNVTINVGD